MYQQPDILGRLFWCWCYTTGKAFERTLSAPGHPGEQLLKGKGEKTPYKCVLQAAFLQNGWDSLLVVAR